MEAENSAKSICAVRPKGVRYLVSALGFFDAFSAGNGIASAFGLMLAKFRLDLHLPSADAVFYLDILDKSVNNRVIFGLPVILNFLCCLSTWGFGGYR